MIIAPKMRGFICTTAHPAGCSKHVEQQIDYLTQQKRIQGPKRVLIIGASTGYGLASRITASFGSGADTIGVFFEKAAAGKRTASAGWYNTAAFETKANQAGLYAKSINGDAFSNEIKKQTIDLIKKDWGSDSIDLVIYSLASPRRTDPSDGQAYMSTLKPLQATYTNKTVDVHTGTVSDISIDPASQEEIDNTVKVMGGEDWLLWMEALNNAGVLAQNVKTLAYSYIGPKLTYPVYREGTIGKAKEDLEATTSKIEKSLGDLQAKAFISVNKALVTQASSAIPVVPLYISILYKLMKAKGNHEGCIEQMYRLFADRLYTGGEIPVDDQNRIRIDDWELEEDIQTEIEKLWLEVSSDNLSQLTDIQGYKDDFYHLFGYNFDGIDYDADVDPNVTINSINE
jgi:enoyl-[acyl-carrier protein] reductase / trans-2-enoyl-CoA reductase (NAD+)